MGWVTGDRVARDEQPAIVSMVRQDGSVSQPLLQRLVGGDCRARDLADAVHHLCTLHGRQPGLIDHALGVTDWRDAQTWLAEAAEGFVAERAYLVRLAAAAGPSPSTPGQAATEAALVAQRHAIDMLAQSVRPGCALGAAMALALDWPAVRVPLDAMAERIGLDVPPLDLPPSIVTHDLIVAFTVDPAIGRAMTFGAQQLLAQHRGLWDLIDARIAARGKI